MIARRVRELGVFSEIITINQLNNIQDFDKIKGIILSGGPSTVTKKVSINSNRNFSKKIPILGICYGLQLISKLFRGSIKSSKKKREFGRAILIKKKFIINK